MLINFLPSNSQNYQKERKAKIEWIVMHYTGNKNDTAKNNAIYFHNNVVEASSHYFVDDNDVYQSVRDEDVAWHCGAKEYLHPYCRNDNSLGVEMCGHFANNKIYASEQTLLNSAKLVRMLSNKYNIPIDHVIRHYDVTGKKCPSYWIDNNGLEDFKEMVTSFNKDKVSVVMCTYNGEKYLKESIESVINQTYSNWELMIVDDGSTDNTKNIISCFMNNDSRIKYFYQNNLSSSSARNIGISHSTGRYIAFLDSDDLWCSDFLEKQLAFMERNKAHCACCAYEIIDKNSKPIGVNIYPKNIIKENDMAVIDHVGNLTGLYDTKFLGKMYLNEKLLSLLDDYYLWYEISKKTDIYGNQDVLAKYRLLSNSVSAKKIKSIPKHFILYKKYMNQSNLVAIKNTFVWGIYSLNKYAKIVISKLYNK